MKSFKVFLFVILFFAAGAQLYADEAVLGLLARCVDENGKTVAELSTEKSSDGTKIGLSVYAYGKFYTEEYVGSDARSRADLEAGKGARWEAVKQNETARTDMCTVDPAGAQGATKIKLEARLIGTITFPNCTYL